MTAGKSMLAATALIMVLAACSSTREVDIDTLCPPRPETSAIFQPGTYPPAARPYREAALMAYDYMMGIPDMTCLLETGKPYNLYQHNAYVSKTHAAHIESMIALSEEVPELREKALALAKASAEYLLSELEPADAPLAFWPPTYIREPLAYDPETDGPDNKFAMIGNEPEAAVKYRGEVMLLYPANVGIAFAEYYKATGDGRFLDAAVAIAGTYLKVRHEDNCWPLKLELATGKEIEGNTLVPTRILLLFKALADITGDRKWRKLENETFGWLAAHPLKDWNWDGQFEDISPEEAYRNPTKHNAIDVMLYLMERFPNNPKWMATCKDIMDFCEKRFVMWETPENHPDWPAPAVLEQYSCFTPIDASAAKMISAYLAMYKRFGNETDLMKARTLADSITRVQKESGRIPTFWEGTSDNSGVVSDQRYDWLNCMESAADALFAVAALSPVESK
ncbi:MAG: hypothetical protein MJY56_06375 [Bacteroidales bacterium]|nr:hypothetical protein [Bacteroidales bacterium]